MCSQRATTCNTKAESMLQPVVANVQLRRLTQGWSSYPDSSQGDASCTGHASDLTYKAIGSNVAKVLEMV
jgi:hypothetical protein